jgi:acyl-CoA thioester hydrolase
MPARYASKVRKTPTRQGRFLEHRMKIRVRFREVDAFQMVWHGHYIGYFELSREAFGELYGITYQGLVEAGLAAPIVHVSCDYKVPARYGDTLEITVRLFERAVAKLEFAYEIRRVADGVLLAEGQSVQVFTTLEGELVLRRPEVLEAIYQTWSGHMQGEPAS